MPYHSLPSRREMLAAAAAASGNFSSTDIVSVGDNTISEGAYMACPYKCTYVSRAGHLIVWRLGFT